MQCRAIFVLGIAAVTAAAATAAESGIYGRLDVQGLTPPQVLNPKPVLADASSARASMPAVYVHIPPGDEKHWRARCRLYDACDVPVHFVTETWFVDVYLPSVGAQDGREQRYREQMGRQRGTQRDEHDVHPD
jgi:hypothetical protein